MKYKIIILTLALIIGAVSIKADTDIDVIVIGEDDVTGYINGTSINGSVYYYIDGIEVSGEFDDVWSSVSKARGIARDAYGLAGNAYSYADVAYQLAKQNNNSLIKISYSVDNNTYMLYMVRDELVAFEDNYLVFKNNTSNQLDEIESKADTNALSIDMLKEWNADLVDEQKEIWQYLYLYILPLFGFMACFLVVIWVFHKQKTYIGSKISKSEDQMYDYIDKQIILEKEFKEQEELNTNGENRRAIRKNK